MKKLICLLSIVASYTLSSGTIKPLVIDKNTNFVYLTGFIGDDNTSNVITTLIYGNRVLDQKIPIYIILNSTGGYVEKGFELISTILRVQKSRKVIGSVIGQCSSMCFTILQAIDTRIIDEEAFLFNHKSFIEGKAGKKIFTESNRLIDIERNSFNRFKLPKRYGFEYTLVAKQAFKYRVVDKIVKVSCSLYVIKNNLCPIFYNRR